MKITPNFSFALRRCLRVRQVSVCEQRNAAVVEMVLEGGRISGESKCFVRGFFLPALFYSS